MPAHRFDEIRSYPVNFNGANQSVYRSHQILQEVKRMLAEFYSADAILDIIALLEQDLPRKPIDIGLVDLEKDLRIANLLGGTALSTVNGLTEQEYIGEVWRK